MNELINLVSIATKLNGVSTSEDRYHELLRIVREVIPHDASLLTVLKNEELISLASFGFISEVNEKSYSLKIHSRLETISRSETPILFEASAELSACLGCPLIIENKLIGVLTIYALRANPFGDFSSKFLKALAALAAASLRTAQLLDQLEETAKTEGVVRQNFIKQVSSKTDGELIGKSTKILHLKEEMRMVAKSDLAVLVTGESGTGKELVARGIHSHSHRFDKPLVYVNCAALPETIAESELFGHKRGSFTGAIQDRMGKFEVANRGTLFLDEIGELPLPIQAKLLRVIQEGEIQRVGEDRVIKVDVRIIAATNRNLEEDTKTGPFRLDLFHRLNVYPLKTPPLREHIEDIPLLVSSFFDYFQRQLGCRPFELSVPALNLLEKYYWPGNIRELRNMISRVTLHAAQETSTMPIILIEPRHLLLPINILENHSPKMTDETITLDHNIEKLPLNEALLKFKKDYILKSVKKNKGNWAKAAKELGLHRSNLYHMRNQLKLE